MSDKLIQDIILMAIEAVEKHEDCFERGMYIKTKLDKAESGYWCCFIRHSNENRAASICISYFNKNSVSLRVGECYFDVVQQSL